MACCVFVAARQGGARCKTYNCNAHKHARAIPGMTEFLGNETLITHNNIYGCLARLWDSDYTYDNAGAIIRHIFDVYVLRSIAYSIGIKVKMNNKNCISEFLLCKLHATWMLSHDAQFMAALSRAQRHWRTRRAARVQGPHLMKGIGAATNSEDVFSLAPMTDIPQNEVFSIEGGGEGGQIFTFHAPYLFFHIVKCGAFNPLTREPLSQHDIERLVTFVLSIPWSSMPIFHSDLDRYRFVAPLFLAYGLTLAPDRLEQLCPSLLWQIYIDKLWDVTGLPSSDEVVTHERLAEEMFKLVANQGPRTYYMVANFVIATCVI